jgi:hypothetical protein
MDDARGSRASFFSLDFLVTDKDNIDQCQPFFSISASNPGFPSHLGLGAWVIGD